METKMFCYQCEQTAQGRGCTICGACGKSDSVARAQDRLTEALVGLARAVESRSERLTDETEDLAIEGLFMTITNVCFDKEALEDMIRRIHTEKARIGFAVDYNLPSLWREPEDVRSLKSCILFGLRGMAAYAFHAKALGRRDQRVMCSVYEFLRTIGASGRMVSDLLCQALRVGEMNLLCMELLDRANTQAFGVPGPVRVPLTVRKGPFVVVTGHDLRDLEHLLKQSVGRGVDIYTHGEMLPAHGYPGLRQYAQLRGHFGTAWQNQQQEFTDAPGAFLFTTNCLMPPRPGYKDNVFTTGPVSFPGVRHIDGGKDFLPVISRAWQLGGYTADHEMRGLNGGSTVTTGFGWETILPVVPRLVEAIRSGAVRHIFLVGGCDGQRGSRSYYTEFVRQAPKDTIILTLACGKFRFNDLDLGQVAGLPRLIDLGQCNDAYGAIRVAQALAQGLGCGVNELPLSFVLSWYEQKAVAILLTLLHLGIGNIRLGPTLPAFVSPGVLRVLSEAYGLKPTTTPEADLKAILA